jgi:hypothetical protein
MAIGTNFSITGDATATVGYDIDDEQFGFKNESNSDIHIGIVWCAEEASMADENEDGMIGGKFGNCTATNEGKVGMTGWVGSIELKDFRIVIDSGKFGDDEETHKFLEKEERYNSPYNQGTDTGNPYVTVKPDGTVVGEQESAKGRSGLYVDPPTIVATLKNGPLFLRIFDRPASKADLIPHIEEDETDLNKPYGDNMAESHDKNKDVGLELKWPGITVGYKTADLSLAVGLASEFAYDDDGKKDDLTTKIVDETKAKQNSSLAVSAELDVNVGPATLKARFVQGLEHADDPDDQPDDMDNDTGLGVTLKTDFGDVELTAGADIHMTGISDDPTTSGTDESMNWEAGGNATVTLTEHTSLKSNFIHSTKAAAATDVEVVLSDKSGLVEDLSLGVTWGLFDIVGGGKDATDPLANDQSDLFLQASLGYAIHLDDGMDDDDMMMKGPTLTPSTKVTINQIDGGDATVGFEIQALLEHAIPATTFGLKWKTAQLLDTDTKSAKQGVVTLWSKIKY